MTPAGPPIAVRLLAALAVAPVAMAAAGRTAVSLS